MRLNITHLFVIRLSLRSLLLVSAGALNLLNITTLAQLPAKQRNLDQEPLAMANVQPLGAYKQESTNPNRFAMYEVATEDPLSFYSRTQDGEWLIPTEVQSDDPWVRLLVLTQGEPTLVDVAIEINQKPYRSAREQWIDKILAEARTAFLVRTGAIAADAGNIDLETSTSDVGKTPNAKKADAELEEAEVKKSDDPSQEASTEATTSEEISSEKGSSEKGSSEETASKEDKTIETESAEDKLVDGEPEEPEVPMTKAQGRRTRTLAQRLINVLSLEQAANAEEEFEDRERVRWLLAEWTGGPSLMTLTPALTWRRANRAPLWHALDRDHDQVLSSEEIAAATETLKQADISQDDAIDLQELKRASEGHTITRQTNSHPLIVVIDQQTNWPALRRQLLKVYKTKSDASSSSKETLPLKSRIASGDRSLSTADITQLMQLPADILYRVSFGKQDAKIALLPTGVSDQDSWQLTSSTDATITLEQNATYFELSAAQGEVDEVNALGDMQQTQVSIGAVVDGYPLLRLLDHDNNRKLTLRERREVVELLQSLDKNQDGQLLRSELPTPIRLAVTLGPKVHEYLSKAKSVAPKQNEETTLEIPSWFRDMDRNRDGDLSRREFKGNPRQFAKLDRDGDGLISPEEVQEKAGAGE